MTYQYEESRKLDELLQVIEDHKDCAIVNELNIHIGGQPIVQQPPTSGGNTTPGTDNGSGNTSGTSTRPTQAVTFTDAAGGSNNLVPTYDLPDVGSQKCLLFDKNTMIESIPDSGYKGMPKESDPIAREAHLRNLLKYWAWLDASAAKKASNKEYRWPDESSVGKDLSAYPGMWVERSALSNSPADSVFIDALIAYSKSQW